MRAPPNCKSPGYCGAAFSIEHVPLPKRSPQAGSMRASALVSALLDRAIDGCMSGEFDAIVTAPVQKA